MTGGASGAAGRGTILVLYYAERAPLRTAIADHLLAFRRYADRPVIYLNLAVRALPAWIDRLGVDVVVLHTTLLATRWAPAFFADIVRRLTRLRALDCRTVALPQDEFIQTAPLAALIRDLHVDHVFTCAPDSDWRTIYGDLVDGPTTFSRVLTGYLEPETVALVGRLAEGSGPRTIDVGYRAWRPEYWLGRHGLLKGQIAEAFARTAPAHGLQADISVRAEDTLLGDDWYRFLLRSRWTIGVEGGASLIDRDGTLRQRTLAYQAEHPGASFEEVEAACFPGLDGSLGLVAISPRHFEACATRTAQVLVEGSYNGILQPNVHYLPLRRDFANLDEVLEQMGREDLRVELAERAHRDVVASRRYEYSAFVQNVLAGAHPDRPAGSTSRVLLAWERRLDGPSWSLVRVKQGLKPIVRRALERTGLLRPLVRLRARARRRAEG